jgi:hypothetical protein
MIEAYCKEFCEDYLAIDDTTIDIRIRKIFYADFVEFMRRKGCKLTEVHDKYYYIFLTFEWAGEQTSFAQTPSFAFSA